MTDSRPRDYFDALRDLSERYFGFWAAEREVLLNARRLQETALSSKLGVSLQAAADTLPDNATDEQLSALAADIEQRLPDDDRSDLRTWLRTEKGRDTGRVGVGLRLGMVHVLTPNEVLAFNGQDFAEIPPVYVLQREEAPTTAQAFAASLFTITLPTHEREVTRDQMPREIRDRFDEMASALFNAIRTTAPEQVDEDPAVRATYRPFARAFYPWAISLGATDATPLKLRTPSFFRDRNSVQTCSDPLTFGAHRALSSPTGWVQPKNGIAHFNDTFSGLRFSIGGIVGEDSPPEDLTVIDNDAWLDPKTSIVHEAILAKWLHAHRSNTLTKSGAVAIRVDEILDMRGAKKHHKGGFRREDKVDISKRLMRLESVFVRGQYTDPEGKKHGVKGRLVNVTIDEELDLLGNGTPYAFLVKPGDATWSFYAESTYLTDYFMALARLDVRQGVERMAYLIGRYLIHQWRIREAHQNFAQPYRVATILDSARIDKEANHTHFLRFREQFDRALDRLQEDGVLAAWQYVEGDEESLPDRGWFAKWVDDCRVIVTPPASVIEHGRLRAEARSERVKALAAGKRKGKRGK